MFKFFVVFSFATFLVGCDETQSVNDEMKSSAKDAIYKVLKDPDSAKFGEFTVETVGGISVACFTVNAKNSFGGYVGDREFSLMRLLDQPWEIIASKEESHMKCVSDSNEIVRYVKSMEGSEGK
ncbi:hypothetical protein AB9R84_15685 (plasmid) [Oceanimonas smirnovii]|uniref:hypothetical protein n=1 Tax=Oceanimonas smirnovii TaxID=264574 RepID=UPI003AACFBE5